MILDPDVENNGVGKPVEYEKIDQGQRHDWLSNYVRKSSDTMNGTLPTKPEDKRVARWSFWPEAKPDQQRRDHYCGDLCW